MQKPGAECDREFSLEAAELRITEPCSRASVPSSAGENGAGRNAPSSFLCCTRSTNHSVYLCSKKDHVAIAQFWFPQLNAAWCQNSRLL